MKVEHLLYGLALGLLVGTVISNLWNTTTTSLVGLLVAVIALGYDLYRNPKPEPRSIHWTDEGPILHLSNDRIVFAKLQTPENPPKNYDLIDNRRAHTYEYGSYTSDHNSVDLILTEDIPNNED